MTKADIINLLKDVKDTQVVLVQSTSANFDIQGLIVNQTTYPNGSVEGSVVIRIG